MPKEKEMKCPRCGNQTLVVYEINDGNNLWGCSVCRDGKNKTKAQIMAEAVAVLGSFQAAEGTEQLLPPDAAQ